MAVLVATRLYWSYGSQSNKVVVDRWTFVTV
jgi:hypothetical protein